MCVYVLSRYSRLKDTDYSFEIYWHNGINGDNRIWMEIKFGFRSQCPPPFSPNQIGASLIKSS